MAEAFETTVRHDHAFDLIAATALACNCTLVTHNLREFGRVPGLLVEDWQAE